MGCRQVVRHRTLTPTFRRFESYHPSQKNTTNITIFKYLILIVYNEGKDMKYKILELTKDNENSYLKQVANLEQVVLANMEERGQKGQLFPTGAEDISFIF